MNSWKQVNASNGEDADNNDTDESNPELGQMNKSQYLQLKRKLKFLIYVSLNLKLILRLKEL